MKTYMRRSVEPDMTPSDQNDLLISEINSNNIGWTADTCLYQKTHPKYSCNADKQLSQIESVSFGEGPKFKGALEKA